jgi:cysteine desulfurase
VGEIAEISKERGVIFHTDAVQTAGKIPGRLADIGANLVSLSGHKFYGPKGAAALYMKEGTPLLPVLTGGAQERGLRAGTENVAGIVGLSEAMLLACSASEQEGKRLQDLRGRLERNICEALPGVKINGESARRTPNTSNLSFESVDGESIVLGLELRGICVSTGSACSTEDPDPSNVLLAMGLSPREAQGSIRLSLGKDTREEDIDATVSALVETVGRLRSISSA